MRLWDGRSGQSVISPLKGHTNRLTSLALSPDGQKIVSTSLDGTVRMWARTNRVIEDSAHRVNSITFSLDGRHIASISLDGIVRH
jgi:WD40 repeat protein